MKKLFGFIGVMNACYFSCESFLLLIMNRVMLHVQLISIIVLYSLDLVAAENVENVEGFLTVTKIGATVTRITLKCDLE